MLTLFWSPKMPFVPQPWLSCQLIFTTRRRRSICKMWLGPSYRNLNSAGRFSWLFRFQSYDHQINCCPKQLENILPFICQKRRDGARKWITKYLMSCQVCGKGKDINQISTINVLKLKSKNQYHLYEISQSTPFFLWTLFFPEKFSGFKHTSFCQKVQHISAIIECLSFSLNFRPASAATAVDERPTCVLCRYKIQTKCILYSHLQPRFGPRLSNGLAGALQKKEIMDKLSICQSLRQDLSLKVSHNLQVMSSQKSKPNDDTGKKLVQKA